jgi:hypothetical protein
MPSNGEVNSKFGVYRNVCCGREIIIREGATFPDCANHPKLSTVWKTLEVEIADVIVIDNKRKNKSDCAA